MYIRISGIRLNRIEGIRQQKRGWAKGAKNSGTSNSPSQRFASGTVGVQGERASTGLNMVNQGKVSLGILTWKLESCESERNPTSD